MRCARSLLRNSVASLGLMFLISFHAVVGRTVGRVAAYSRCVSSHHLYANKLRKLRHFPGQTTRRIFSDMIRTRTKPTL